MLKIRALEIEGFRGITQKSTIEFDSPVTLLYGGNHQGKSSILNAIEWCLWGDECIGEKSGIRERVGTGEMSWRIVNDNCEKAVVKVVLEGENGVFTITRAEAKGKGKKGKSIEISLPGGTKKKENEAEREIEHLLQISFKDFATTIYQHQETIRDFVIQRPSEQSDAMDRLLGLYDYRNILEGIKRSEILKIQKELANEFEGFKIRLSEAIKIKWKELEEKIKEAKEKNLGEDELNEKNLLELGEIIIRNIGDFAHQLRVTPPVISLISDWKNTGIFITDIKKKCNRLWTESPDLKEQEKELKRRNEVERLKSKYETQYQAFKSKEKELQDFEATNGNREEIENKISKVIDEANYIEKKIKEIAPKAKLVEEGISILESAVPSYANICPLCGKEVPNLLEHLRKEWKERIEVQVQELKKQEEELSKRKTYLGTLKEQHKDLHNEMGREKEKLQKVFCDISSFLNKELGDKDDPLAILSLEIKNIDSRLKEIETAIKEKRSILEGIEEKIEKMRILYDILLLKNKIEEINKIKLTDEYQTQEKIKTEVSNLVSDVEEIVRIIKSCMLNEAKEKIEPAKSSIDCYFRKITNNPAFQSINIKVEEDRKTGGNLYIFEDQDSKRPVPILSQGDLNSFALSIFLGLAKSVGAAHPLGFILMDDPSQSLDTQQKAQLVEVLDELSDIKDLIISTMDIELVQFLKDKILKVKTIYKITDWSPASGPKISKVS